MTNGTRVHLTVNGRAVDVSSSGSLLEALRDELHLRSAKDGCSPQGQCGCCTVLVDGQPRVACVTPVRRMSGRSVQTLEGLDAGVRDRWAEAFTACGASQCGFCTPGIIVRLEAQRARGIAADDEAAVEKALLAHLCRCTGWRSIVDAYAAFGAAVPERDLVAAGKRAALEGGARQQVGVAVALGDGGFADDSAPVDALVAVPDGRGGWSVGESLHEARLFAGKVQGRRSTVDAPPPITLPEGDWHLTLQTSWVEPAYLETDASWCLPGGEPANPLGNGGAFGGKAASVAPAAARRLADEHGRAVRVLLSREDTVRMGPKRPPLAAGVRSDGSGVIRVATTEGVVEALRIVGPQLEVVEVDVPGPPTSVALRAAGWAEAMVLLACAQEPDGPIVAPNGARAQASVANDGRISVWVSCGPPLDDVVLRSYCMGAAHMAVGLVTSERLAVDEAGDIHDLTVRSFGVLRATEMPPIDIEIDATATGEPVNGSDAVFVAVAAAVWRSQGCPPVWPTGLPVRR